MLLSKTGSSLGTADHPPSFCSRPGPSHCALPFPKTLLASHGIRWPTLTTHLKLGPHPCPPDPLILLDVSFFSIAPPASSGL